VCGLHNKCHLRPIDLSNTNLVVLQWGWLPADESALHGVHRRGEVDQLKPVPHDADVANPNLGGVLEYLQYAIL